MDSEKDITESEDPNWGYPLLRIGLTGAFVETTCASVLVLLARIGFVPPGLNPIVDFFVSGAATIKIGAAWIFSLYLWIRPGLYEDPDS